MAGLGKGLGALIAENDTIGDISKDGVREVSIDDIIINEQQPRKTFEKEKITELAESIKTHGVLQPLIVIKENGAYRIVAGERRFRASVIAGLKKVPVIIKEYDNKEMLQVALIENVQREDLNELEAALGYAKLRDEFEMTQDEIASKIGKSRASIANSLRLLSLPEDVAEMIRTNVLTPGHGRAILALENENLRSEFAHYIVTHKLSVRESEKLSKTFTPASKKVTEKPTKPAFVSQFEEDLCLLLGTKVAIKQNGKKGMIQINYTSNEELERLLELLKADDLA